MAGLARIQQSANTAVRYTYKNQVQIADSTKVVATRPMKPSTLLRYLAVGGKTPPVFDNFADAHKLVLFIEDHIKAVPEYSNHTDWERIATSKFYEVLSTSADSLAPSRSYVMNGETIETSYQERMNNFFLQTEDRTDGLNYKKMLQSHCVAKSCSACRPWLIVVATPC
ncbi:unnamed protein product [Amoebophrya sp. A120]|nr:unnamed protein product [Amoebophrya sp. A120]|eukprot:GSA120T00011972001.1